MRAGQKMTTEDNKPNIISIAGRSGSGKTTFLEKVISHLKKRGYRLGIIKHAHCGVDIDKKGKDSWRHKNAGAAATLVISPGLISMVKDYEAPDSFNRKYNSDGNKINRESCQNRQDAIENCHELIEKESDIVQNESAIIEGVKHYLCDMDIIIVEGFKYASLPKFEIFRVDAGHDIPLFLDDRNLVAFITDSDYQTGCPIFGLDDAEAVADLIEKRYILTS